MGRVIVAAAVAVVWVCAGCLAPTANQTAINQHILDSLRLDTLNMVKSYSGSWTVDSVGFHDNLNGSWSPSTDQTFPKRTLFLHMGGYIGNPDSLSVRGGGIAETLYTQNLSGDTIVGGFNFGGTWEVYHAKDIVVDFGGLFANCEIRTGVTSDTIISKYSASSTVDYLKMHRQK